MRVFFLLDITYELSAYHVYQPLSFLASWRGGAKKAHARETQDESEKKSTYMLRNHEALRCLRVHSNNRPVLRLLNSSSSSSSTTGEDKKRQAKRETPSTDVSP